MLFRCYRMDSNVPTLEVASVDMELLDLDSSVSFIPVFFALSTTDSGHSNHHLVRPSLPGHEYLILGTEYQGQVGSTP